MTSVTGMSPYALPALGSEIISVGEIPDDVISSSTGLPSTQGQTTLEINARTVSYSGDFYSLTPKTDDSIRSLSVYTITLELTAVFWISNLTHFEVMKQTLADTVLASTRSSAVTGYDLAFQAQTDSYYEPWAAGNAQIVRVSNTTVIVTIPQFTNYELPANGFETISPLTIPLSLVEDAAVVTLKSGTSSVLINARTAAFSGTFFSSVYKTDADMRGSEWSIFIDLTFDFWAVDIVLDATKRQGLVNVILASDKSPADTGYSFALQTQTQSWPSDQMVRMSNTRVRIDIKPFGGYTVPAFGVENVAATIIPAELVVGVTSVKPRAGVTTVVINGRTASYSGTLFAADKTDQDIKITAHTVVVELSYEYWALDLVTDSTKRQSLIDAVLSSNRETTDYGYGLAMAGQRQSFLETNVVLSDCVAIYGCTKVTITVPAYSGYALIAQGSETISVQDLPASIVNSTQSVTLKSGSTSLTVVGRSVTYSGSFFSTEDRLDDAIRSPAASFTITAVLTAEKWHANAIDNAARRQILIEAIMLSNKPTSAGGFENGFAKMIENFPLESVVFTNQTTGTFDAGFVSESSCALCDIIIITIPSFPNYISGRIATYFDAFEIVETQDLPASVLQGSLAIDNTRMESGLTAVTIKARYLTFSGTFFSSEGKTAEDLQNAQEFLVIIDINRDQWHPDIDTNATLRNILVDYVFTSNHPYTEAGYEYAMNKQVKC